VTHLHEKVSALVDGELNGAARRRAVAHARRCDTCREEIAQTLLVKQRLHGLPPVEPTATFCFSVASVQPTMA
jgi:anti-sigma factor RsiW